jgi:hypothetical protein
MRNQLLDPGLADTDKGKLGRDKETGSQNEEGDQNDAKKYPLKHVKTSVNVSGRERFLRLQHYGSRSSPS